MSSPKSNPRFKPGEEIHELFWDDDINAWNVSTWECDLVKIVIDKWGERIIYCDADFEELGVEESPLLFKTSLQAANEAKKRNDKERVCGV